MMSFACNDVIITKHQDPFINCILDLVGILIFASTTMKCDPNYYFASSFLFFTIAKGLNVLSPPRPPLLEKLLAPTIAPSIENLL